MIKDIIVLLKMYYYQYKLSLLRKKPVKWQGNGSLLQRNINSSMFDRNLRTIYTKPKKAYKLLRKINSL